MNCIVQDFQPLTSLTQKQTIKEVENFLTWNRPKSHILTMTMQQDSIYFSTYPFAFVLETFHPQAKRKKIKWDGTKTVEHGGEYLQGKQQ